MRLASGLVLTVTIAACGLSSTSAPDREALTAAAESTAELGRYSFEWSAGYRLMDPDETGRDQLEVSGFGVIDEASRSVDATFVFDDSFIDSALELFPGQGVERIESFSRVVDGEVYIRGWNAAFVDLSVATDYSTWYRATDVPYRDAFTAESFPAEAVAVIAGLLEDGEREGDIYTVTVDRDAIIDLGDRFPGSLVDFQLRIGGGDFVVTGDISGGMLGTVRLQGDDPGSGVSTFVFELSLDGLTTVDISPPTEVRDFPLG